MDNDNARFRPGIEHLHKPYPTYVPPEPSNIRGDIKDTLLGNKSKSLSLEDKNLTKAYIEALDRNTSIIKDALQLEQKKLDLQARELRILEETAARYETEKIKNDPLHAKKAFENRKEIEKGVSLLNEKYQSPIQKFANKDVMDKNK